MYFMRVNKSTPVTPISGRGSTLGGYSEIRIGAARFRAMHWIYIISVHKPNNQFSVCLTEKKRINKRIFRQKLNTYVIRTF